MGCKGCFAGRLLSNRPPQVIVALHHPIPKHRQRQPPVPGMPKGYLIPVPGNIGTPPRCLNLPRRTRGGAFFVQASERPNSDNSDARTA